MANSPYAVWESPFHCHHAPGPFTLCLLPPSPSSSTFSILGVQLGFSSHRAFARAISSAWTISSLPVFLPLSTSIHTSDLISHLTSLENSCSRLEQILLYLLYSSMHLSFMALKTVVILHFLPWLFDFWALHWISVLLYPKGLAQDLAYSRFLVNTRIIWINEHLYFIPVYGLAS